MEGGSGPQPNHRKENSHPSRCNLVEATEFPISSDQHDKSRTIARIRLSMYALKRASRPTEDRADLLLLSVLYVCVFWRGEAGHLEIEVLARIF